MKTLRTALIVLAQCSLLLSGCGNHDTGTDSRKTTSSAPQDSSTLIAPPGLSVSHDLRQGKRIFTSKCLACHGSEKSGAPQLGSATDWEPRLQQPLDVLIQHAIQGHGRMPPKGGFKGLSDTDIAAAVAYVVSRSERIVASLHRQQRAHGCQNDQPCNDIPPDEVLTLHMLWMLGNPSAR